jgi:hypothetical protein
MAPASAVASLRGPGVPLFFNKGIGERRAHVEEHKGMAQNVYILLHYS